MLGTTPFAQGSNSAFLMKAQPGAKHAVRLHSNEDVSQKTRAASPENLREGVRISGQGVRISHCVAQRGVRISGQYNGVRISGQRRGVRISGQYNGVRISGQRRGVRISGMKK